MLAPGTYKAQARRGELGVTETDKESVGIEFEIVDGPSSGTRVGWYGYFTEQTETRTLESLRFAGWTGDSISDLTSLERDDVPVVDLVVEHETWEGKLRAKVRWVNRPGGISMKKPLEGDRKSMFEARIRALAMGVDAVMQMKGNAAPKETPVPPMPGEPRLPF